MPNRGRTRFLLAVIRVFLTVGLLGGLSALWDVYTELHARHTWPVADGFVVVKEQKSADDPTSPSYTNYWVEYEVRFAVPADQCETGTISADKQDPMPCWGTVRTRTTRSPQTVYDWLTHHGPQTNSRVRILHNPNGPDVKIADESAWLVYRWDSIFLMLGWLAFFLLVHALAQRRLRYLETLPEDYDASPPPSPREPNPDDPIDLKFS